MWNWWKTFQQKTHLSEENNFFLITVVCFRYLVRFRHKMYLIRLDTALLQLGNYDRALFLLTWMSIFFLVGCVALVTESAGLTNRCMNSLLACHFQRRHNPIFPTLCSSIMHFVSYYTQQSWPIRAGCVSSHTAVLFVCLFLEETHKYANAMLTVNCFLGSYLYFCPFFWAISKTATFISLIVIFLNHIL